MTYKTLFLIIVLGSTNVFGQSSGDSLPSEVKWMYDEAKWGISHHYLAGGELDEAYYLVTDYEQWNHYITHFDVDNYARLAKKMGVGYVILTITQNRGYLCTTSTVWDQHSPPCPSNKKSPGCLNQAGTRQADYTPSRDLLGDLAKALKKEGIRTIAYLPSHVGDRWTGKQVTPPQYPDWYISDFIGELARRWGTDIAGWWFDGYWNIREQEQANDFPVATKIWDAIRSGNPNAIMTLNNGGGPYTTHDKFSQYTPGEANELPALPTKGRAEGYNGNTVQYVGWSFLSKSHPLFAGWGQINESLKYTDKQVADHTLEARTGGGVSSWDVAINLDGSFPLDRLKQLQTIGLAVGKTKDKTYSSLNLINNDDENIQYIGNWKYHNKRKTGEYRQDVHITSNNGDSFKYKFSGESIVLASSKAPNQGNVEILIDGQSQGIFSIHDPYRRQVQVVIFEKHNLKKGEHSIEVKKISGDYMTVDLMGIGTILQK